MDVYRAFFFLLRRLDNEQEFNYFLPSCLLHEDGAHTVTNIRYVGETVCNTSIHGEYIMSRRRGKTIVVVGAQWGDEDKGKLVDIYAEQADVVVRFEGGTNAGHTLVINGRTFKLHLLPSGIVRPGKLCMFGPGGVFDLKIGCDELALVREFESRILLDRHASVVLPIHRAIDAGREAAAGKSAIGTTLKGIGPAYADFWLRRSIKLGHLTSEAKLREKLLDG